ncbi:MAG TPA: DNA alkylation repair protein [Prosthecobacter sp.]|nr:DNA alkylation repair protein [Prosthecobacter sp.]
MDDTSPAPALKDWFDAKRFRATAKQISAIYPAFDSKRFLALALAGLDDLTLMQRLRRMTESLHATLPGNYRKSLAILRKLAPEIDHGFVTLALPDYVALYGQDDFETSMDALEHFTVFGSAEFAIREFLKRDLARTLAVMKKWSLSENEHVRRLASEGCRPRLPWSFKLAALIADPTPALPILENLRADPSLYVRKSVANHLNDITKDHATWVMDRLESWPLENAHTAWIAKRALRTLIKKGDIRALAVIGAGEPPQVLIHDFVVQPRTLTLGNRLTLSFRVESKGKKPQRLVIDYAVRYVKKSGGSSAKVFKWKEVTLAPGATVALARSQVIRDFTTRLHHPGRHEVEILINGQSLARDFFDLMRA